MELGMSHHAYDAKFPSIQRQSYHPIKMLAFRQSRTTRCAKNELRGGKAICGEESTRPKCARVTCSLWRAETHIG